MFKRIGLIVWLVLAGGGPVLRAATNDLAPLPESRAIIRALVERLPEEHVTGHPLDDEISQRAWKNYLGVLDPNHLYFLASDITEFRAQELMLDDELRRGEADFAFRVFNVFRERARERTAFVTNLLSHDMDLTVDEVYVPERKHAGWATNAVERDTLWRKVVKNEYVARVAAEEAKHSRETTQEPAQEPAREPDKKLDKEPSKEPPQKPLQESSSEPSDELIEELTEEPEGNTNSSPRAAISRRHRQFLSYLDSHDASWVLQVYLVAVTHAYDPHCEYMSPAVAKEFDIDMKLSLSGIGASLNWDEGITRVVHVLPGGPASRDGRLKAGDRIVAVAQEGKPAVDVTGRPLQKVVELIRGKKGTRVTLTVLPAADATGTDRVSVELVRDIIKLDDQAAKGEVRDIRRGGQAMKLGVISLPAFYGDMDARADDPKARSSTRDIAKILKDLKGKGAQGMLLDLRNNGGGSLREAVDMTGLFIREGPVVQVRQGRSVSVLTDDDGRIGYSGPLVVLVNRATASSSEILAGALQDYGRAVIVGDDKTHGKGTVQSVMRLGRDERLGRLKVTRALFYRISGGSTQLKGVTSDIVLPSLTEGLEIGEDYLDNPLEWTSLRALRHPLYADLAPTINRLQELSEKRRAADANMVAFTNLLARVAVLRKIRDLPLNLERRKAMGEVSRELKTLREKVAREDEDRKADLVMAEGVHILADLVDAWPQVPGAPQAESEDPEPAADEAAKGPAPAGDGDIEAEIPALVEQLGHPDPGARREARARLQAMGRKARPFLEKYRNHRDPEIRSTVRELMGGM